MKGKILNLLLVITSLFGYLEWSGNNHSFLFEAEAELFTKLFSDPKSVLHPFILLPLLGQILLLITLFQKVPDKRMIYFSIGCLGLLLGFMFIIGLYSQNFRIVFSTIPFLVTALLAIRFYRNNGKIASQ
jgi:uncharacterized protein YacL